MKKLNRLLVVEADPALEPLLASHEALLLPLTEMPVAALSFSEALQASAVPLPQLILLHTNLLTATQLRNFVELRTAWPFCTIVITGRQLDEELCLLSIEAGADDCLHQEQLTPWYLRKAVLRSLRNFTTGVALRQYKEQLLACLQNTPNVAVQWYNGRGEVLFWNKASETLFGWTEAEALGQTIDRLIQVPGNREYWLQKMVQVAGSGSAVLTEEWNFARQNGTQGYCLSTLFTIPSFEKTPWYVCMDVDMTDRHLMEEALRNSEENYHSVFNQASDAIFINTLDGRLLDVNQQACELLNLSKSELLQKRVDDLFSTEELAAVPIMRTALGSGERTRVERRLLRAGADPLPVEITAQKLKDGRVIAIVRDISERRKVQEELQRSEEKYRSLIDQLADGIAIFDDEGRIREVNASGAQLLGYTKEELLKMTLADVNTPEDMASNPVEFGRLKHGETTIKQRQMRRKDGSLVEVEVNTKRLWDGLFLSAVRDLAERLDVQRQLEKEIVLSNSIINSLPGLFYLFRKDGKYLRWNKQLETMSGYTGEEISNMSPLDFFVSDDVYNVFAAIEDVYKKGASHVEAYLATKDGRRIPFYFTGIAVQYAGADCVIGTGIDLSAMKRLERELSEQKIAAQKKIMQAMIEAGENEKAKLGLELHDNVNQILSVVRMYLAIMASDKPMEEVTLPKAIDLLNSAIDEIRHLSHNLAVSYRFETGLAGALEDTVEKISLAKGLVVHLQLPSDLDALTTPQQKLAIYRIVQEQLANVIKHAKAASVEISLEATETDLQLRITDDGRGFDLSKTKKGLGLNNITNRAEALGGKTSVYAYPGQGCRLEVALPLRPEVGE